MKGDDSSGKRDTRDVMRRFEEVFARQASDSQGRARPANPKFNPPMDLKRVRDEIATDELDTSDGARTEEPHDDKDGA